MSSSHWDKLPRDIKWLILQRNWREQYTHVLAELTFELRGVWRNLDALRFEGSNWIITEDDRAVWCDHPQITAYKFLGSTSWWVITWVHEVPIGPANPHNLTAIRPGARH